MTFIRNIYHLFPNGMKKLIKLILALIWKRTKNKPFSTQSLKVTNQKYLVTVVIPVFNHTSYLIDSLKSVLNQTYTNLEVIIVDDGSEVFLWDFIVNSGINDDRIIYIRQEHQGLPAALNTGFDAAHGEYLTWTSADNRMGHTNVEEMLHTLIKNPNAAMVYCDYSVINEYGVRMRHSSFRMHEQDSKDTSVIRVSSNVKELASVPNNFIGPCFLYTKMASIVGDYDDSIGVEDYDYWVRINNCFEIIHFDSPYDFYEYRVHGDSLSAKAKQLKISHKASLLLEKNKERQRFINNICKTGFPVGVISFSEKSENIDAIDNQYKYVIIIVNEGSNHYSLNQIIDENTILITFNEEIYKKLKNHQGSCYLLKPDNLTPFINAYTTAVMFDSSSKRAEIEKFICMKDMIREW